MSRYLVIGCSGSGKSTVAREIADICDVPYHDTDSLYWCENWKRSSDEEVIASLPLDSERWVIDGNFVCHRHEVWQRATSIIWLDLPHGTVMRRVIRRNLGWWISQKPTWSGGRMPLGIAWSGICHAWKQRERIGLTYPAWLGEMNHATVHRICGQAELEKFLRTLSAMQNLPKS